MIRYMKILKLWEYVSGEIPRPNQSDVSMDEILEWDEANNEAEGILMSSITKGQMQLLTICESAHEMWEKLKETYQAESQTNKMRLLEQFHSFFMKRNVSIEVHIRAFDSLIDKLRGVGELVSDHLNLDLVDGIV